MIVNSNVAPFASERRNKAKVELFLPGGTLLRTFLPSAVAELTLVQEFHKNQTAIPRSEINFVVDNRDHYFDITDPNNIIFSLTSKCYCEPYLSSVENGMPDAFVKKSRLFYDGFTEKDSTVSLKFTDAVSHSTFNSKTMPQVFAELDVDSASTSTLLGGVALETKYDIENYVPDEKLAKYSFSYTQFQDSNSAETIKSGLFYMAKRMTQAFSCPVYFIINDEGKLTFQKQNTEASATISKSHYITCTLFQKDGSLISRIYDRGNILCQLGDVIRVVNGDKSFQTEVYKIEYKYSKGVLSSEWEGVVLQ